MGNFGLEKNPPLLQLEVCTSDMNVIRHPGVTSWGVILSMFGGYVF